MLEHMLSVGTAPGGGNRSHLTEALSHIDKEICRPHSVTSPPQCGLCSYFGFGCMLVSNLSQNVSCQTLDMFRWRAYRWVALKEFALWKEFVIDIAECPLRYPNLLSSFALFSSLLVVICGCSFVLAA